MEAKGQEKDKGKNKSYHLKAIAVVQCPWREVLYLVSWLNIWSRHRLTISSPLSIISRYSPSALLPLRSMPRLSTVIFHNASPTQDSDSVPTRDPEYMFTSPNYARLGLWATPDYWKTSANNPIWAIMGVKCRNEWEMETGQMFVDKKSHLDVFLLIKYMLERHEFVGLPVV